MRHGQQVHPDDLMPPPPGLTLDDAWEVARSIINAEHLPESERLRLMWGVYKALRIPEDA